METQAMFKMWVYETKFMLITDPNPFFKIDFPAITFTNEGRLAILYEKMFLFFLILSPQEVMRILQDSNNFEEFVSTARCRHHF